MKDTGSRILLRAVDEFERLRGTNLAWFGLDELTYAQEGAWLRLEGRLRDPKAKRRCGFAVWTPKGFDWVYRKFIEKPVPGYEVIQAQPFENRFLLEQVPDFYDRLKDSYDENFFTRKYWGLSECERRAWCMGRFRAKEHVQPAMHDARKPMLLGGGFQRGSDVFGDSADRGMVTYGY